jgi:large subunit ribosomal protein L10
MRPEKQQLVEDIRSLLGPSTAAFLMTYKGLDVSEFSKLRATLDDSGAECHVVPNRLLGIALKGSDKEALASDDSLLSGDTAMVTGGDPVNVAQVLRKFTKEHPELTPKCAVLRGKFLPGEDVDKLAEVPPREVLLAQLLGVLQGPMRQLVGVLNAKNAAIVYVLQAYLNERNQQTES